MSEYDIREGSHAETLDIENFVSDSERAWLAWVKQVEKILGHDLDGNEDIDGYSLDGAYAAWEINVTARQFADEVVAAKKDLAHGKG